MKGVGPIDGKLQPCPRSPNCVCSQERDPGHRVVPWSYEGDAESVKARLLEALKTLPRTKLVTEEPRYLHATCTSAIFRFVDDLELLIEEDTKLVHVRSASRTGWSDLGVNRRRVAQLRTAFESASAP